jgi:hypothetical protein
VLKISNRIVRRVSVVNIFLNAEAFIAEAMDTGLALPISPALRDPSAHLPDNSGALSRDEAPVARGAWIDASMSPVTAAKGPQVSVRGICHAWSEDGANRAMRIAVPRRFQHWHAADEQKIVWLRGLVNVH